MWSENSSAVRTIDVINVEMKMKNVKNVKKTWRKLKKTFVNVG